MKHFLLIAILMAACESPRRQIGLTQDHESNDSMEAEVPEKDSADPAKSPDNIDASTSAPAPTVTNIKDVDAKLPKSAAWVASTGGAYPPDALVGGYFGSTSYFCRAMHNGAYLPGQMVVANRLCYVGDGNVAVGYSNYEILTLTVDDISSVIETYDTMTGEVPKTSIPFGLKNGVVQAICLVVGVANTVYVGRADASIGGCLYVDIEFAKTMVTKTYTILISK